MSQLKNEIKMFNIKFFQSIKISGMEMTYLEDKRYDITLYPSNQVIVIIDKTMPNQRVFTTLANVPWSTPIGDIYTHHEDPKAHINAPEIVILPPVTPVSKPTKSTSR